MGIETNLEPLVVIAPIPGFPGYLATWAGEIWSMKLGRFLPQHFNKAGYRQTHVLINGKYKTVRVHRLIALAFIPNPLNLPCVNHLNGEKDDNRPENLEWATHEQNCKHARDTGLNPSRVETPLWTYNIRTRELRFFESAHAAARYTGKSRSSFSAALSRPNCRCVGEWLVAKPGEAFRETSFPLLCIETGDRFCNSNELIAAGFRHSDAIKASKKPHLRAGNKTGQLFHFVHEPIQPLNHITDQNCWCKPVQDSTDPTIWIHNAEALQETN